MKQDDREIFDIHNIHIIEHQPWQFGLIHKDLLGKFVWYPTKGTLMFEEDPSLKKGFKMGEFMNADEVIDIISKRIKKQTGHEIVIN